MKATILALPLAALLLNGCAPALQTQEQNMESVAGDLGNGVSCDNARSAVFGAYYKAYESASDLSAESFENELQYRANQNELLKAAPDELIRTYHGSLAAIHRILTQDLDQAVQKAKARAQEKTAEADVPEREDDPVLHLIRLEMRSQLDPVYDELNSKLDQALEQAHASSTDLNVPCGRKDPDSLPPERASQSPGDPHFAALWTMATAYQSCQVLDLPPVTKQVETVQGVIRSVSIDGVGWGRKYTDVNLLKKTHYYHHGQSYGPACANQSAKPLVYDYGGIPVSNSTAGTLDLFTNSGGGPALGIDCSAFVSTSAAVAGNLYKAATTNKPVYTRFVSRDFIDPVRSGWNCYDSVKVNDSAWIRSGDIGAVEGHVVMVDQVGADPFGLAAVTKVSQCDSLSYKNFDFSLIQSSPSKEHLGINRYLAKDYLAESSKMATLFVTYAKQACKSKFDHVERKPGTSSYGLIRHKTAATCQAPRVKLKNEACIERCAELSL